MALITRSGEILPAMTNTIIWLAVGVGTLIFAIEYFEKKGHFIRLKSTLRPPRSALTQASATGLIAGSLTFLVPFLPFIISAIFLIFPIASYRLGKHAALEALSRQDSECATSPNDAKKITPCTEAIDKEGNSLKGYVVAKSNNYFALTLNGTTQILPVEGYHFRTTFDITARIKEAHKVASEGKRGTQ
jgi:hypothetical protein